MMWPVDVLLFPLPDSFSAAENEDFFELRHRKCGQTVATFTVAGAQPKAILQAARTHQCLRPKVGVKFCIKCKREIGELVTTCPYCGAENLLMPE